MNRGRGGSHLNRRGFEKHRGGPAVTYLPPHMKALFEAREPPEWWPPAEEATPPPLTGLAEFVANTELPPRKPRETVELPKERRARIKKEKEEKAKKEIEESLKSWNPKEDPNATSDAYKTVFVGRLAYETSEKRLEREFEKFGPIKQLRIVKDPTGKSRGYAFIEYEKEEDIRQAVKLGSGLKIDERRVVVDVERGRTVPDWRPRRLGGGVGTPRDGRPKPRDRGDRNGRDSYRMDRGRGSMDRGRSMDRMGYHQHSGRYDRGPRAWHAPPPMRGPPPMGGNFLPRDGDRYSRHSDRRRDSRDRRSDSRDRPRSSSRRRSRSHRRSRSRSRSPRRSRDRRSSRRSRSRSRSRSRRSRERRSHRSRRRSRSRSR